MSEEKALESLDKLIEFFNDFNKMLSDMESKCLLALKNDL